MSKRDTTTGRVLEEMILPALKKGGYTLDSQFIIGERPSGGKHKVDVLAEKDGIHYLISLKWQQVSGTTEEKVPFEVICLIDAVRKGKPRYLHNYRHAYIVLAGSGWKLKDFYINKLSEHLKHDEVTIIGLEDFITIANRSKL